MEMNYSVNKLLVVPNSNLKGNYVNLPEKVLESISRKNFEPPYYFKLIENTTKLQTFVGVKEFTAEPNTIEVSPQIQENILYGEFVKAILVNTIPKADLIIFKVNDETFYDLPEYDKFLEAELSNYCLIEKDKKIFLNIMDKEYIFSIQDLKIKYNDENLDADLADIVNIDLNVDFEREIKEEPEDPSEKLKKDVARIARIFKKKNKEIKKEENEKLIRASKFKMSKEELRKKRLAFYQNLEKIDKKNNKIYL